jgi:enediyne biosynthesis protein E4
MVTDAKAADIDKDGKEELIIVGDWMPVTIMKFTDGMLSKSFEIRNSSGWWNDIEVEDIDNDGDIDLIVGNTGLNSRIKGEPDKPAKLYVGDFDKNGQIECVPVYFKTDGHAYPYFMKGELQSQIPQLKKDFLYFTDYAGKPIEKIFSPDQLKDIEVLEVKETRNVLFRNDGRGVFTLEAFPQMAQLSYVFSALADDLNGDHIKDLFMAGNFYGLKPQAGRFDASYGVTLLGGKNGFSYMRPSESGLFINGEVRDIKRVKRASGGYYILVGVNNQPLKIFSNR